MTAREPAIRLVQQLSSLDCGVACVAMLTGVEYERVAEAIGEIGHWGANTARLKRVSAGLGVELVERDLRSGGVELLSEMPSGMLLFVFYGCANPHFVVWDADSRQLFDPAQATPLPEAAALNYLKQHECRLLTLCEVKHATP